MTIFDQFRRENSSFSNFLPLKTVNFGTKIKIDTFSSFSRICSFWTKNGTLTSLCISRSVVRQNVAQKRVHFQEKEEKSDESLKIAIPEQCCVLGANNYVKSEEEKMEMRKFLYWMTCCSVLSVFSVKNASTQAEVSRAAP